MSEEMCEAGSSSEVGEIVVSGRKHKFLPLASALGERLVKGERLVVVHCEKILWPITMECTHQSPVGILWCYVSAMLARKTKTADRDAAMARFKAYVGLPPPYHKMKRVVIPRALETEVVQPGHKYRLLGGSSKEVGRRRHYDTIQDLEETRRKRRYDKERRKQLASAMKHLTLSSPTPSQAPPHSFQSTPILP